MWPLPGRQCKRGPPRRPGPSSFLRHPVEVLWVQVQPQTRPEFPVWAVWLQRWARGQRATRGCEFAAWAASQPRARGMTASPPFRSRARPSGLDPNFGVLYMDRCSAPEWPSWFVTYLSSIPARTLHFCRAFLGTVHWFHSFVRIIAYWSADYFILDPCSLHSIGIPDCKVDIEEVCWLRRCQHSARISVNRAGDVRPSIESERSSSTRVGTFLGLLYIIN